MHAALSRFWAAVERALEEPPESIWRLQFETAVLEIASNIVRYAYPIGLPPGLMRLRLRAYPDRVEARFDDCGVIVNIPAAENASADDLLDLPESGRGLMIARVALDRLHYRRTPSGANCWRLVKRLARPSGPRRRRS